MSCVPPASSNSLQPSTNIFVCLHFYMITFSSSITPIFLDELNKEWHVIDNHLVQVRQVESRPVSIEETTSGTRAKSRIESTASSQQGTYIE
ncbi:hypothetical protein I4U23_005592 [Adineta vaga]|nr:hypothetical protein I4U23_005592 [Adineta vaga]